MKEITEKEANRLSAGAKKWPILIKTENNLTESAVCLKELPNGYLLGVSCDTEDVFKLFYSRDFEMISQKCQNYLETMSKTGNPFGN